MRLQIFKKIGFIFSFMMLFMVSGLLMLAPRTTYAVLACPQCVPTDSIVSNALQTNLVVNSNAISQKTFTLDRIASMAAKIMLQSVTNSVVTWINSGFQGSPAFLTNPSAFFTDVGDQVAGNFIAGTDLGFVCAPFNIRLALNIGYSANFRQTNYCRLSDAIKNVQGFTSFTNGNFSQGGWNSWFQVTQNSSGNPLGAYVGAKIEMDRQIQEALGLQKDQLNWGQGFLSWSDCVKYAPTTAAIPDDSNSTCLERGPIKTPGSVIEAQLNQTLGSGQRQLEVAQDINQIVSALMGQLVQTVFTQGLTSFGSGGHNSGSLGTPLTVTCIPNITTATTDDNVTWTASVFGGDPGPITYSWSGSEALTGRQSTANIKYATRGTKNATITVTKNGRRVVQECQATVNVPDGPDQPPLAVLCSADKARANIDETITWTAQLVSTAGNIGETTYVWSGSDPINGHTTTGNTSDGNAITTTAVTYSSPGTKTAVVAATRNGQTVSGSCNNSVEINPPMIVSCSPNRSQVTLGSNTLVQWNVDVTGGGPGAENQTYLWSGSDPIGGHTEQRPGVFYTSTGTKNASVLVSRWSQSKLQQCSSTVLVLPPPR